MTREFRCGLVAIVGRPNVGKSTLLNQLVGQKISITSRRPQTTRHRIMGVATTEHGQAVYVDTPGLHLSRGKTLNRFMNRAATGSLEGVDCILLVINAADGWTRQDEYVLELLGKVRAPVVLLLNKIDKLKRRDDLLPLIDESRQRFGFAEIIPVSALKGTSIEQLQAAVLERLPEQPPMFPEDQLTDRSERFLAAELIREQVFRHVGQEVPYSVAVGIEAYKEQGRNVSIQAVVYVERSGQKAIIIGDKGERIKAIRLAAQESLETLLGARVHLELWVKVKEKWADDAQALRSLGYGEFEE